jgi:hypothetical protein
MQGETHTHTRATKREQEGHVGVGRAAVRGVRLLLGRSSCGQQLAAVDRLPSAPQSHVAQRVDDRGWSAADTSSDSCPRYGGCHECTFAVISWVLPRSSLLRNCEAANAASHCQPQYYNASSSNRASSKVQYAWSSAQRSGWALAMPSSVSFTTNAQHEPVQQQRIEPSISKAASQASRFGASAAGRCYCSRLETRQCVC